MIKGKEIFVNKSSIFVPYGSFVGGESHDFDFFCTDFNLDLVEKFEKVVQQDSFKCVQFKTNIWRKTHIYYKLKENPKIDICHQNDFWGIVASACIKEQIPNVYAFLLAEKAIVALNKKLLLKTFEKNVRRFSPGFFVNYKTMRKLSFALLQCKHLKKCGKVLPSKKAIKEKYPQFEKLLYGSTKNPYDLKEGIVKINEIKKGTIDVNQLCKLSFSIEAKKLSKSALDTVIDIVEQHDKIHYDVEGVMVAKTETSYVIGIVYNVSDEAVYVSNECPIKLFEEVKEKGSPVYFEEDLENVCWDIYTWGGGL